MSVLLLVLGKMMSPFIRDVDCQSWKCDTDLKFSSKSSTVRRNLWTSLVQLSLIPFFTNRLFQDVSTRTALSSDNTAHCENKKPVYQLSSQIRRPLHQPRLPQASVPAPTFEKKIVINYKVFLYSSQQAKKKAKRNISRERDTKSEN